MPTASLARQEIAKPARAPKIGQLRSLIKAGRVGLRQLSFAGLDRGRPPGRGAALAWFRRLDRPLSGKGESPLNPAAPSEFGTRRRERRFDSRTSVAKGGVNDDSLALHRRRGAGLSLWRRRPLSGEALAGAALR